MVTEQETADLAEQLIDDSAAKERIVPGALTLHVDPGSSMRSKPVATLLSDLGIAQSHSRPYVSGFCRIKQKPKDLTTTGSVETKRQAHLSYANPAEKINAKQHAFAPAQKVGGYCCIGHHRTDSDRR